MGRQTTSKTVLYLEDSPADAALARHILEPAGYRLEVVDTPSKALSRLWAGSYRAFFVDHVLGRFRGAELVLQLRDIGIELPPTYVVSGSEESDLAGRSAANGADGFIHKGALPDYAEQLLSAVRDGDDEADGDDFGG